MQRNSAARLIAALTCVLLAGTAPAPDATRLLRRAVTAYASYSFSGQVQNVDFGTTRAQAVLFRIEHRAPEMTRRWYLAPESLYGDYIISRGDTTYDVDPHTHRIIVSRDAAIDDQVARDDNFGLLLHNYRAITGPQDDVAGRRAITVWLVSKYTGQTVMRISLDARTDLVLQKERYSPSGSVSHQMRFEQIAYAKRFPAGLFSIPSHGYAHIAGANHGFPSNNFRALVRSAGFHALGPRYLPDGFLPIAGDVSVVKGVRTLHLLYSDGLRTVSLFENARGATVNMAHYTVHATKVGSNEASYVQEGPTTLLAWADEGLHFELVGELSTNELLRIASSAAP